MGEVSRPQIHRIRPSWPAWEISRLFLQLRACSHQAVQARLVPGNSP
jgi:hypothetical protein